LGFFYEGKNVQGWHYLSDLIARYYRTGRVEEASIETSFTIPITEVELENRVYMIQWKI
jgi:hypothetical protein